MGSSMSDGQLDMRFSLRAVSFDKQFLKVKKKNFCMFGCEFRDIV